MKLCTIPVVLTLTFLWPFLQCQKTMNRGSLCGQHNSFKRLPLILVQKTYCFDFLWLWNLTKYLDSWWPSWSQITWIIIIVLVGQSAKEVGVSLFHCMVSNNSRNFISAYYVIFILCEAVLSTPMCSKFIRMMVWSLIYSLCTKSCMHK